jgi:hypothetical protein
MKDLIFNAEDHTYYKGDLRIPGISELLKHFGYIDDQYYTEAGRELGIAVHALTVDRDFGGAAYLDIEHPGILGRLDAWERFKNELSFAPSAIEAMIGEPVYNLACRIDRAGIFGQDKRLSLVEIKCGAKQKWHCLQTAGQALCARAEYSALVRRFVLYLHADGKFELCEHTDRSEVGVITAMLAVYWNQRNMGIIKLKGA